MKKKTIAMDVEWACRWLGFDYASKHGFPGPYLQMLERAGPIQHTLGIAKPQRRG